MMTNATRRLRALILLGLLAASCAAPTTVAPATAVATASTPVTTARSAPPVFPCGRVTALTAPTATAAGAITLGTTTFELAPGSWTNPPPPIAIGTVSCLSGEQNAAGQFLAQAVLVADAVCGTVTAFTAASAAARGSITIMGKRSVNIPVRAGVTLSAAQTSGSQCFSFDFDAAGNTEIVGFAGAVPSAPAAPSPVFAASECTNATTTTRQVIERYLALSTSNNARAVIDCFAKVWRDKHDANPTFADSAAFWSHAGPATNVVITYLDTVNGCDRFGVNAQMATFGTNNAFTVPPFFTVGPEAGRPRIFETGTALVNTSLATTRCQ